MKSFDLRSQITESLLLSEKDVSRLIARAPHTYKKYTIKKKSGGIRWIAQPARETKLIQRFLINNHFRSLPIHSCALAYVSGTSIRKNAEIHAGNAYISKFDFTNFFGSITGKDVLTHLSIHLADQLSLPDLLDITRISCIANPEQPLTLSIGAPSSPILSNTVMYEFDQLIHTWACAHDISYSRYADDLTFSSNQKNIQQRIEEQLLLTLAKIQYPRLSLNREKTIHASKKNGRRVTGVTISTEGNISLGRDRKREISSLVHKYSLSCLSSSEIERTQGLLGYALDIEPLFVSRLRGKYGEKIVTALLRHRTQPIKEN